MGASIANYGGAPPPVIPRRRRAQNWNQYGGDPNAPPTPVSGTINDIALQQQGVPQAGYPQPESIQGQPQQDGPVPESMPQGGGYDGLPGGNTVQAGQGEGVPGGDPNDPTAGQSWPNPEDTAAPPPHTPYTPDYKSSDINKMWQANREGQNKRGEDINSALESEAGSRQGLEKGYRDVMNTSYNDLKNTPGYTPGESNDIKRTEQYAGLQTDPNKFKHMQQSDEEFAGTMGDVNKFGEYLTPDKIGQMEQADRETAAGQRGAAAKSGAAQTSAIDQQQHDYDSAIDPSKLGIGNYGDTINSDISGSEGSVRGTIDRNNLTLDKNFLNDYRMSDQDVQDMQNAAATDTQNEYGAAKGDLTRAALASGTADPLAVAAGRSRLEHQSAADSADAGTMARIRAKQEQASRLKDSEGMRIAAEEGYSGLASANEQQLASRRIAGHSNIEDKRLASEQDISSRRMQGAKDVAGNRVGAAQFQGGLEANVEGDIGDRSGKTSKYVVDTGTKIATDQEKEQAKRWQDYYANRNANDKFAIQEPFQQNFAITQAQSQGAGKVADARIAGQKDYRTWAADQTGQATQAGQVARGQQIQNSGVQGNNVNNATGGLSKWEVDNQGNTPFAKALKTVTTLSQAGAAASKAAGAP